MVLVIILLVVAAVLLIGGGYFLALRPSDSPPPLAKAAPVARPASQPGADAQPPIAQATDVDAAFESIVAVVHIQIDEAPVEIDEVEAPVEADVEDDEVAAEVAAEVVTYPSFRDRLARARGAFSDYFGSVRSRNTINQETWDDLEEALLLADVGVPTTGALIEALKARVKAESIKDSDVLLDVMKGEIASRLTGFDRSLAADANPSIWLFVGVNGVGKTTTIGKLARREIDGGRSVVLTAGDTFRAAAAEQLELWAERSGADIVRGQEGGDPAAVVFDAVERAAARGAQLVMADTAGRLHNKVNLMEELRKVRRVAEKGAGKVTEVLLVLDATTGQNGLNQARQFTDAVELTGVVLTKLDGSAKGGIVLAIHQELGIPVKLVGLGEGIGDLVEFDPEEFAAALFE